MRRTKTQGKVKDLGKQVTRKAALITAAMLFAAPMGLGKENQAAPQAQELQSEAKSDRLLIISIPDRKLALIEDGQVLKVYPIAVGAPSTPSPTGPMRIINKIVGPTYFHSGQIIRPGKSNPLGSRWLGLSKKGYGIHGTNAPNSIGKAASHGCFRMHKADVEELFTLVRVGDGVEIRRDRDVRLAQTFRNPALTMQANSEPATRTRGVLPAVVMAVAAGQ